MADEYVSQYRQTLSNRQQQYDTSIRLGEYTPFLYPWDTLPAVYLFLAVIITPRYSLRVARSLRCFAFLLVISHGIYVVSHRRTLWFAGGYGIGLCSAWGMIMSGAVLVCNDIAQDFKRLETRAPMVADSRHLQNGTAAKSSSARTPQDGDLASRRIGIVSRSTIPSKVHLPSSEQLATGPHRLVWQGFPYDGSWLHLIDWTVDLMTSFRGVGWKHRISTAGPVDITRIQKELEGKHGCQVRHESTRPLSIQALRSVQLKAVQYFIISYLVLDFMKTTMITDPYFLGLAGLESPTPWQWLARLNQALPCAVRVVRLSMSMTGVIAALTAIFSLNPLFFATILPRLVDIPKITKAPLLEPSLYPPMWYPLSASVMYSGLAGFWGKFWHQMFRFGISEPSRVFIEMLQLRSQGNAARVIQLLTAFGLSGSIHALGSYTTFSLQQTQPLSGSLCFFLLQGVGVFLQSSVVKILSQHLPWTNSARPALRDTLNVVVVVTWLYLTGPLLANDFARCGIWLFEPVPVSLLRGLGFGPGGKDEGWWTWYQEGSRMMGWWKGDGWWNRGLAIY